jgi:hypothetical protein
MSRTRHCDFAPEFGHWPAQECWNAFLTEEAWQAHLGRWHPSRRRWPDMHPHPFNGGSIATSSPYARCMFGIGLSLLCGECRSAAIHAGRGTGS